MGTYANEDPNASIGERLVNSVKKIAGLDHDPTKAEAKGPTGQTPQEAADSMSGDSSSQTSHAGVGAQSTDAANGY
jgi:hypothetical protein